MSFQDVEKGPSFLFNSRQPKENDGHHSQEAVAAGIFQINTSVFNYKRLVNTLGTPKDTPELRQKL